MVRVFTTLTCCVAAKIVVVQQTLVGKPVCIVLIALDQQQWVAGWIALFVKCFEY